MTGLRFWRSVLKLSAVPLPVIKPRPFLKWAGGKRQLLPRLREFYPPAVRAYFEPFVGSGAVFFDLWNSGRLNGRPVALTDQNADLIGCYLRLKDSLGRVTAILDELANAHARDGATHYYDVRDRRFNPAREAWHEAGGHARDYPATLAAMLIYLNRTGYNGLFRLNARGRFNVPAGRYDRPRIVDRPLLAAVADVLARPGVTLCTAPFESVVEHARRGDLVYFDPPYAPLSPTARFGAYTAAGFGDSDQERLQTVMIKLARKKVNVLLSNSVAPSVIELYERDLTVARAGLRAYRVPARRAINSNAERRGVIEELVVTNLEQQVERSECRVG